DGTQVRDLSPLKDMPLKTLFVNTPGVTDLRPLQGLPLEDVRLTPENITKGLDALRHMKGLKTIGLDYLHAWPAVEFWKRYDKGGPQEARDKEYPRPPCRRACAVRRRNRSPQWRGPRNPRGRRTAPRATPADGRWSDEQAGDGRRVGRFQGLQGPASARP